MSRVPRGHQRTWIREKGYRPCPFLWPAQTRLQYRGIDALEHLNRLERVWNGSRNLAALSDALQLITAENIPRRWVTEAASDAIRKPDDVKRWAKRRRRDLLDVIRAMYYEKGRDEQDGLGLSREESAEYAVDWLKGTPAATTVPAMLKLISRMKNNHARAYGRYYLGAGSMFYIDKLVPPGITDNRSLAVLKWRHRAALRGNDRMRKAEAIDLLHARRRAAKEGDDRFLKLYAAPLNRGHFWGSNVPPFSVLHAPHWHVAMPNQQEINDDLITTSTVAHILDRADNTVRLMERRGDIRPVARAPTGVRLYSRTEIERDRDRLRSKRR